MRVCARACNRHSVENRAAPDGNSVLFISQRRVSAARTVAAENGAIRHRERKYSRKRGKPRDTGSLRAIRQGFSRGSASTIGTSEMIAMIGRVDRDHGGFSALIHSISQH